MSPSLAIEIIINIAATICIFFAVPIVLPVAGTLGVLLIILGALFSIGIVVQIYAAYHPEILDTINDDD